MLFQFFEEEKQRAKAHISLNSQRYWYCSHHHWAPIDKAWIGLLQLDLQVKAGPSQEAYEIGGEDPPWGHFYP